MNDDELESVRERKREELLGGANANAEASGEDAEVAGEENSGSGPDEPIHVDSVGQFSEVTTDYGVVLVDFYADWCGPCKMLEPTVASIARNTDAAVAKVDIDQHQGLATQYGVRSVPTLVLFAGGEQVEQVVGVRDEDSLTRLVERYA